MDFGQAVVEEKRKALDGARLAVSSSVKSALDSYQAALANVETYREKVLQPTEELMAMTRFGYGQGALPFLQVLNAQQTWRTARSQHFSLLLAGRQALDALEAAVGRALEEPQP